MNPIKPAAVAMLLAVASPLQAQDELSTLDAVKDMRVGLFQPGEMA